MHDEHDKELERYLDGDSDESRRYAELGDELPPPELDARILAEAERAVKVSSLDARRAPPFKAFAWAAIFVLSFSLVLNIVFQQAVQDPTSDIELTAQSSSRPENALDSVPVVAGTAEPEGSSPLAIERSPMAPAESFAYLKEESREAVTAQLETDDVLAALEAPTAVGMATDYGKASRSAADQDVDSGRAIEMVADYLSQAGAAGRTDAAADESTAALARIIEMYAEGQRDAAIEALTEFRAEYPGHPVTEALTEQGF